MSRRDWSDPYFLLGVFLTYDGQPERAEKFFQRASDLAGIGGGHIAAFLAPVEEARPVPAQPVASAPVPAAMVVPVSMGTEI